MATRTSARTGHSQRRDFGAGSHFGQLTSDALPLLDYASLVGNLPASS